MSTSHTTAFLRAINHGCLPDEQPPMEVRKDDPCWDLIQNGWSWLILSHLVEGQWPMLPTLLQGAMNSANSISKAPNELELAAQLGHLFSLNVPLHEAKEKVQAANTCQPEVLTYLSHFVKTFSGGPKFPMLDFLRSVAWMQPKASQIPFVCSIPPTMNVTNLDDLCKQNH